MARKRPCLTHRFLLPPSDTLNAGINTVMGVCACGVSKEHIPFFEPGKYERGHEVNKAEYERRVNLARRQHGREFLMSLVK